MLSFLALSATVWNRLRKERAHQRNREKYFKKTVLALHLKYKKGAGKYGVAAGQTSEASCTACGILLTRGYFNDRDPRVF